MLVLSDAQSDLTAIDTANKVWLRVQSLVKRSKLNRCELVVDGVRKSGYVYLVSTRVKSRLFRFTLILRSKSSKQMAAYFGKSGVDIIELNCLPKSRVTTDVVLRSMNDMVRGFFVHEFTHYLDAKKFKSKKRYERHVRDIEKQAKRGAVSDLRYFNFDLERNTHYAEIVNALRLKMLTPGFSKRMTTFNKFVAEAKKLQKDFFHNLTDSNKRRVLSRLYGMYQLLKGNQLSNNSSQMIATGGYYVQADEGPCKDGPGRLFTIDEARSAGRKAFASNRKRGLVVWEELQKSNLFPRGNYRTPPKGFVRACYCGCYITAESGDQWKCDAGIKGYSACYVKPADTIPFKMLDSDMTECKPPRGCRYVG